MEGEWFNGHEETCEKKHPHNPPRTWWRCARNKLRASVMLAQSAPLRRHLLFLGRGVCS
jgi:hypothetical protein